MNAEKRTVMQGTLEIVTPLFLGGTDPCGAPELRAASVRGALRYWLRALLGGVMGDRDLDALRAAEAAVFGSTEGASPVVVRVQYGSLPQQPFSQIAEWDSRTRRYRKPGIAYLFFAAWGTKSKPEREAINAGSSFELLLGKRAGVAESNDQAFQRAHAALWLLTHLGGLGARSRRGAGSLQVTKATGEPNGLPPLCVRATSPAELQQDLKEGLTRLRKLVGTSSPIGISNPSAFNVLHPDVCKVWVINEGFNSWSDALEAIGGAMQRFRTRRNPDYQNVKNAVQGGPLTQSVQRAAFGLPIVFFYSSLYNQYQQQGDDSKTARRKSTGTLVGQSP
ncbi:MAG: type III-B CRISPR module RAMP protein Cmr1 [Candidatus Methanomethylicaceae archaeon]